MRTTHEIEYLAEPRVLGHVSLVVKWPIRFFRAARQEWTIARRNQRHLRALRRIGRPIRLELGSGPRPGTGGWTTVDLRAGCDLQFDLRRPTPFHDEEIDEIYSSHTLEYLGYDEIVKALREWRRILATGRALRLALPNARIFIDAYQPERTFDVDYYCQYKPALRSPARIDIVNYMAYMDAHRYMFDENNVIIMLEGAGFHEARLREFDPGVDMQERKFESLYVLAIK